jgi:uncharacterized membrane protein
LTHTHIDSHELSAAELARHRRALRIMVVVLIPLAIWTAAGLIALWPKDVHSHINADVAGYSVAGVSYPTGRITAIQPISCDGLAGSTPDQSSTGCANITVEVLDGDDKGKQVAGIPLSEAIVSSGTSIGQKVVLVRIPPADGQPAQYQFSDFERRSPLAVIAILFAVAVIAVARWRGFAALLGLVFAGFILIKFMFPALVVGTNPIAVGLIGSSAIMFVTLYAAHGFSARTTTALLGTLFGLVMVATLGWVATRWGHLTGVSSEDDFILAAAAPELQLTSVVICGIIVAGLGVLNDVTITQASAVWELADTDPDQRRLFSRAMRIGRDHIASTVYTIAFATAGAVLPVLLLIAIYDRPLLQVIQSEQFAAEVIRTLVGSIGLVLAVPLTTAVGAAVVRASGPGRQVATAEVGARGRGGFPQTGAETSSDRAPAAGVAGALGGLSARLRRRTAPRAVVADAETGAMPDPAADATQAANALDLAGAEGDATSTEDATQTPDPTDTDAADTDAAATEGSLADDSDEQETAAAGTGDSESASRPDAPEDETAPTAGRQRRFRLRRRPKPEDDFDDFSDLRDPVDPEPPGRR